MPNYSNTNYDIGKAFAAIEDELMASMIRNLKRHKLEENNEDKQWSMWQAEQLKSLERYKKENQKKYGKQFQNINKQIGELLRISRQEGGMTQEISILNAIKNGFTGVKKLSPGATAEFFKLNNRKLNALIRATTHDMQKAETAVLRMANDQYRQVIYNAQVYANTGAGTYEKAVDMATKDFLSRGLNCIQYKNGARHTIADYADMAIRTASKRAYLQGEGEKRQEWGISTVLMNKRGNPCPLCLPFVGKVFIDDVWSGGKKADGDYPLLSGAIAKGLYHPRCRDSHTTYFSGISTPPGGKYTREELKQIERENQEEAKQHYAERQMEKFGRLTKYSIDKENQTYYNQKQTEWNIAYKKHGLFSKLRRDKNEIITYNHKDKDIHQVEQEIASFDYEVGVVFNHQGKAIGSVVGTEGEVDFYKLRKLIKGNDITHNHPAYNTPPSPEDLYVMINFKARSMRTCGEERTYIITNGDYVSKLPKNREDFIKEYDNLYDSLFGDYYSKIRKGELDGGTAEVLLQEEIWESLKKKYGISMEVEHK